MLLVAADGTIEAVDQAVAAFLGREPTTLSRVPLRSLFGDASDRAWLQPSGARVADDASDSSRSARMIGLRRGDGSTVTVQATRSAIVIGGIAHTAVHIHTQCDFQQVHRDFQHLANSVPGIIWTARPDGVSDFANHELINRCGMTVADLMNRRWRAFFHPDDQDRTAEAWWQAIESGEPFSIDVRLYCQREDRYRWHALRAQAVRDQAGAIRKWFGSAFDIDMERRLQQDLEETAARLAHTLESITDGLLAVDHDWHIRYCNHEAERVFRIPRDQVLGEHLSSLFPRIPGERFALECMRAMTSGRKQYFEIHFEPIDLWLEVHAYPATDGLTLYFRDIGERKHAEAEIEFLAFRDALTSLPNRRLMLHRLEKALRDDKMRGSYTGLVLVDLDNFKSLNDTLGHEAGDEVIGAVAKALGDRFGRQGTVARVAGDEFALVLPGVGFTPEISVERVHAACDEILELMRSSTGNGAHGPRRTGSVGADVIGPGVTDTGEAMKQVDLALLAAKQAGGNQYRLFDQSMRVRIDAWARSEIEIPRGMEAGEFVPYYQPQLAADGSCIGAEALIRWHHPERGLLDPREFVPFTEQTGLIKSLGKTLLRDVCVDIARWSRMPAMQGRRVSVNVSPSQLHDPAFVDDVSRIIDETGAPASRLRIELTETMLLEDVDAVAARMDALTKMGITFSLDDFGTGYSALAYLKRLPLGELKIDQGFVKDIAHDASSRAIIQTIVALADSLGMGVMAEGVETRETLDWLVAEGCGFFQGHLFGWPMSAEDFAAFPRICAIGTPWWVGHSA